jgi:hypothetical protein
MNPQDLTVSDLLIWGIFLHLVADWPLQNDWMASRKPNLLYPAAYVHGGIHGALLAIVFGWAAIPLAVAHILIDTRKPVQWWSRLMRQTKPGDHYLMLRQDEGIPIYDMGLEVRIWTDQVFHIICIAVAALVVA